MTPAALSALLVKASTVKLEELAQMHFAADAEIVSIDDVSRGMQQRRLVTTIDAIGRLRFPGQWIAARDSAGFSQEDAA